MPTNARTQQMYRDARRALNNIARSVRATDAQVAAARLARSRLSREFIGERIDEVDARTEQFRRFIAIIDRTIRAIGRASPIRALLTLQETLDAAKSLLDADE